MYAELKMELEADDMNYRQSSNLQGVIMEKIDGKYAKQLHAGGLNPYSQSLVKNGEKTLWQIRTITKEAYENLLLPISTLTEFEIKDGRKHVGIAKKNIELLEEDVLLREFYERPGDHSLDVCFQTPTAFKSGGKYVFYPDLHLFYQSLMTKYTAASQKMNMTDNDTLEQLEENSEIVRYRLQTVPFPLEKTKITGFVGTIRIHIRGSDTMARYARLLVRFGRFSGVGIKAAMGMGAMLPEIRQGERT